MENEILKELWDVKDSIAKENNFDIDQLAKILKEKQENNKHQSIDLSDNKKKVA